jgi:hypothetical protein
MKQKLFFFLLISKASVAQLCFAPAVNYQVDTIPCALASADFNGDLSPDLVTANYYQTSNVSLILNTGVGTFGSPATYTAGNTSCAITATDFNNDGFIDVAVANNNSSNITILTGTGTGGFSLPFNISTGNTPTAIANADFNGDGKQDLVVTHYYANEVMVLIGNGLGNFPASNTYTVGTNPLGLVVGDFNYDGNQDIAIVNSVGSVSILLGTGTGGFNSPIGISVGGLLQSLTEGDFNNDGKQDLATIGSLNNTISILSGDGLGGFTVSQSFTLTANSNFGRLTSGDFDADGNYDLVISFPSIDTVGICLGDGTGGFSSPYWYDVGRYPTGLLARDYNLDGKLDLAVANQGEKSVSVLLNCTPVGIQDNGVSFISISPVPTSGDLTISSTDVISSVQVYGALGDCIVNTNVSSSKIKLHITTQGVYTVVTNVRNTSRITKVVVR